MIPSILPTLDQLGVRGYSTWYPGQDESVAWVLGVLTEARVAALCRPVGGGKSAVAWATAIMRGEKAVFLTPTKALQDQYSTTLASHTEGATVVDVRGQNAYRCVAVTDAKVSVEDGPCHSGYDCTLRQGGCAYFDAVRAAQAGADIVVTNPYLYLKLGGIKGAKLLVCDEADVMLDALGSYLSVTFTAQEAGRLLDTRLPEEDGGLEGVQQWAKQLLPRAEALAGKVMSDIQSGMVGASPGLSRHKREVERLLKDLRAVVELKGDWVATWKWRPRNPELKLQPVWPSDYVEKELFRGVPSIILMGGTLLQRDVELLLESAPGEWKYREFAGFIPPEDRSVTWVKTCQMSYGRANYGLWTARLDQLVAARLDRKGVVDTTSYDRRDKYMVGSRWRGDGVLVSHGAEDFDMALAGFKEANAPQVFVSPSLVRGYDVGGTLCEWIAVGKVPWPDTRDPVVAARKARDPLWPHYQAMKTIEQEAGRGARWPGDRVEVLVVDDDWGWFWPKFGRKLATNYFRASVREGALATLPEPPPKLLTTTT